MFQIFRPKKYIGIEQNPFEAESPTWYYREIKRLYPILLNPFFLSFVRRLPAVNETISPNRLHEPGTGLHHYSKMTQAA